MVRDRTRGGLLWGEPIHGLSSGNVCAAVNCRRSVKDALRHRRFGADGPTEWFESTRVSAEPEGARGLPAHTDADLLGRSVVPFARRSGADLHPPGVQERPRSNIVLLGVRPRVDSKADRRWGIRPLNAVVTSKRCEHRRREDSRRSGYDVVNRVDHRSGGDVLAGLGLIRAIRRVRHVER